MAGSAPVEAGMWIAIMEAAALTTSLLTPSGRLLSPPASSKVEFRNEPKSVPGGTWAEVRGRGTIIGECVLLLHGSLHGICD